MKNGKNPTVRQSKLMTQSGLQSDQWLVVKHTSTEMVLVHRETGETTTIVL